MDYDIRNISIYVGKIHSRYFIDTNGVVYTSISNDTYKIMIDGVNYNIRNFVKSNIQKLNMCNMMMKLPYGSDYFLCYNGLVLKRIATRIDKNNVVDVSLVTLQSRDRGNRWKVARLMGYVFLNLPLYDSSYEIHHIDRDRSNNRLDNLVVMSFEEHRGKGNFTKNHNPK